MKKRILITGGAGFIGTNLALKLLQSGHEITVLDNLSEQIHGHDPENNSSLYKSIAGKVKFIKGTVTSTDDLKAAIAGQDAIVHYAAETGTGQSMYQIAHYAGVNVGGTALLLDLLGSTKHHVSKLVIASSRAIYGEGKYWCDELGAVYPLQRADEDMKNGRFEVKYAGCTNPLKVMATDEEAKIHPSSIYGITKQNQEQMIMTVCPSIGIAPVSLRYQNVYGPGQSLTNPYTGIMSIFSSLIRHGKEINIFEDGEESRDFVFIDDVVEATILAIEQDAANNQIFNVGSGVATKVITLVNELIASFGVEASYKISGNYRIGDIRHNFADITKITNTLGFKCQVPFNEGIKSFVNWVNTQHVPNAAYEHSLQEMKEKGLFK